MSPVGQLISIAVLTTLNLYAEDSGQHDWVVHDGEKLAVKVAFSKGSQPSWHCPVFALLQIRNDSDKSQSVEADVIAAKEWNLTPRSASGMVGAGQNLDFAIRISPRLKDFDYLRSVTLPVRVDLSVNGTSVKKPTRFSLYIEGRIRGGEVLCH